MTKISLKVIMFLMVVSLVGTGCVPEPKPSSGGGAGGSRTSDGDRPGNDDIISGSDSMSEKLGFSDIFFGYNSSTLTADSRRAIKANVAKLKTNKNLKITIAGHCDERGSSEYNLGLGEDRAKTVKKYLVGLGINSRSITVTSYGEEQPQCSAPTSSCWQKNRRAQFLVR